MLGFILFLIALIYLIYKLLTDRPVPPNSRIDWEAEDRDRQAGMSWEERQKKWKRNEYWTTEPKKKPKEILPGVVDIERYEKDKYQLGESYAERMRSYGEYMIYKPLLSEIMCSVKDDKKEQLSISDTNEASQTTITCKEETTQMISIGEEDIKHSSASSELESIVEHYNHLFDEYGFNNVVTEFKKNAVRFTAVKDNRRYGLIFSIANITPSELQCIIPFMDLVRALHDVDLEDVGTSMITHMQQKQMSNIKLNVAIRKYYEYVADYNEPLVISGLFDYSESRNKFIAYIEFANHHCADVYRFSETYFSEDIQDQHIKNHIAPQHSIEIKQQNTTDEVNHEEQNNEIDFDSMDGHEFENYCAEILKGNGYKNVSVTRGSGDQGIDIIAYKDDIKYGIQCKCYATDVGNKAIQEVFSGKTFYSCHVGVVLTNSNFTKSAIELARNNGIILWNRAKLLELIKNSKE